MNYFKTTAAAFSLLSLIACNGAQVSPDGNSVDNAAPIGTEQEADLPQNGLTFANNEETESFTPQSRLGRDVNVSNGATLDKIQNNIIADKCAICHAGGEDVLPGSMDFTSATASYESLVNIASTEYPKLALIAPGMSSNSYLVRKIEGTQLVGKQMPRQGGFLSADEINLVKAWIDNGALR